jgi:hypothetical protein
MERARLLPLVLATVGTAVLAGGCDPKFLNGVADNTHDPLPGGGGSGSPTITTEAIITGAIVSFHAELMAGALTVAGDHDTGPSPFRSFLTAGCMNIAVVDAQVPIHSFDLAGCTDANGTVYSGLGELSPAADSSDAYSLIPDTSFDGTISAANTADPDLTTTVSSGSLKFAFARNGGTVSGITVSNFLRHFIGATPNVSFSYDVTFTGGIGEVGPYPDNGGVAHVAWDGVGVYDVEFNGGPNATYRMQGQDYEVNLDTGAVQIVTTPVL